MDESPIDAEQFARVLLAQRATRLKGGIYHLTQVEMAYNTNRIEGSRLSEEQTRYLYETRTVVGDALVDDVVETTNSFRAFDAMLDHVGRSITGEVLKDYHRILKTGTADADQAWFAVGDWKRVANEVGATPTTPPGEVGRAVDALLARTPASTTFEDVCDFHVAFERIHPFQDGNGRIGRLVMFEQCLAAGIMPFVVLDADKAFYYRGLAAYDQEPGLLRSTFRHFQDAYHQRFADFVPRVIDHTTTPSRRPGSPTDT